MANNIWTVNKYIRDPVGDGGLPRILTIKVQDEKCSEIEINDNEDKARTFTKSFFPPPLAQDLEEEAPYNYPPPLPDPALPTKQQTEKIIQKLSPYKAPGQDRIPNIVLQKSFDDIADYLISIYRAILELGVFFDPWREFTTLVIRKPDKPNYVVPKAYWPIALISTMVKVLTALVAKNISQLVKQHQLLPKNHFGADQVGPQLMRSIT